MNNKPPIVPDRRPSRRAVLAAGVSLGGGVLLGNWPLCATQAATSQPGPRVAALGWACAQTLLALGVVPLVVPEIERYGRLVVEPAVPSSVQEIGLRSEPNLELLQSFAPDIIIIDPSITAAIPRLKLIAPVEIFTIFKPGRHPSGNSAQFDHGACTAGRHAGRMRSLSGAFRCGDDRVS